MKVFYIDLATMHRVFRDPPDYPLIPPAGFIPAPHIDAIARPLPVFYGTKGDGCPP